MKLSFTIPVALVIAVFGSVTVEGRWLRHDMHEDALISGQWSFRAKEGGTRNLEEGYGRIYSDSSCIGVSCGDGPFCIELKDNDTSDRAKLTLGDCTGPGWRLDSAGLFHSEVDDDRCMQASQEGRPEEKQLIRMFGCDPINPLQQFAYEGQQLIKPIGDLDLCMVWQGNTPDLYEDNIILLQCDKVSERIAWSGDFPTEEECSLSDPQRCALYDMHDAGASTCPSFFPVFVECLCPDFFLIPSTGIDSDMADEWCAKVVPARDDDCVARCSSYLQACCPLAPQLYSRGFGDTVFAMTDHRLGYVYNTNDIPGGVERGPNASGAPGSFEFIYDDNAKEWLSYHFQVNFFNGFMSSQYGAKVESIERIWSVGIGHDGMTEEIHVQFGIIALTELSEEEFSDAVDSFLANR